MIQSKLGNAHYDEVIPNILIVDDRKENLLATEKVLQSISANVYTASSGNEALSLMLRHPFAIVLLDVQMPEMDGFEVATLMQEDETIRDIPIIFVTAISKEDRYASRAADIGAVDYIFKPINPDILKSKVKVYLDLYIQREKIINLNLHLQQTNQELERFAYICSHDMQEPVRMINCHIDMIQLEQKDQLDPTTERKFENIKNCALRLNQMIQDILIFSRVGREEVKIENVNCHEIVQEVIAEFDIQIGKTNARICCEPLPEIQASITLIRVLFQNLIGNALKFQDGRNPPEIEISVEATDPGWTFCVKDNGIGIEPQFQDRVFELFQKLHRKEQYPGTGIGLSTCKKLIEMYGGHIWFQSQPDTGTQFYFSIKRMS